MKSGRFHGGLFLLALAAAGLVTSPPAHAGPSDPVARLVELLERPGPFDALEMAELLVHTAQANRLDDKLAGLAGSLLGDADPFVRGLAEWAIAMKVGGENSGQQTVWPKSESPAWYAAWASLSPEALLEADWVRQAFVAGVHRDAAALAASVGAMARRAEATLAGFRRDRLAPETLATLRERLAELRAIHGRLEARAKKTLKPSAELHRQWIEARRTLREIALANPVLDFDELLFVTGFAPHTVRNITRSYPWKHKPGGSILVLSGMGPQKAVRDVLAGKLGPGHVRGIDLDWDAARVVFGYARQARWPPPVDTSQAGIEGLWAFALRKTHEPIHLFEIGTDGSGLEQLTDDPYWSDFEPTYGPGGEIVFVSERCGRSPECGSFEHDHVAVNLHRLSADRKRIEHLTDNKDYDRYPHCLDNGLIAYTHWEYQERHFMEVHALWTVRPDGTMADALFKHHMGAPLGLRDTRSIPGSTKLVSIATGHHTFAYGPVVVIDPRGGLNRTAGIEIVTPGVMPQEGPMAGRAAAEGGVADQGGLYQTPWALSEDAFLAAYAYARPKAAGSAGVDSNGFALYYLDVYGNKELIYRDRLLSCASPIPLRRRPRPPAIPEMRKPTAANATCYVADVYEGLPGVPRGTVKYLRIAQHVAWPFDSRRGAMPYLPGNAFQAQLAFTDWAPVRVIGTVRVEADGSAQFEVPANTALYFQALDERWMEVRRMRSMVSLAPGEMRGCRGCHESRAAAPAIRGFGPPRGPQPGPLPEDEGAMGAIPLALCRPPQTPEPPPWGAGRLLGYEWLVQPVFDRHCTRCHSPGKSAANFDLTATRAPDGLAQSFRTLFGLAPGAVKPGRALISIANRFSNASVTRAMEFGAHRSRLIQILLNDDLHVKQVQLSQSDWLSLVTWVDANAPYYDAFVDKRPAAGAQPVRNVVPELSGSTKPCYGNGQLATGHEGR